MTAGRAERRRSDAVRQGQAGAATGGAAALPALEEEARRTRDEAAAFGEGLVARRLERERRSGAAVVWREAHARNAARLLALCVGNGPSVHSPFPLTTDPDPDPDPNPKPDPDYRR